MATLPTRLATQKAIQQTLARRPTNTLTGDRRSYAEVCFDTTPATHHISHAPPPTTEPIQHLLSQPNRQPPAFNAPQTKQPTQNRGPEAINEGWTRVTRRKVHRRKQERDSRPKPNKRLELLKAQGRCFKCLDRGHTQHQCRNGVKCIKCHCIGHISRMCKTKAKEAIYTAPSHNAEQQQHPPGDNKPQTNTPMDFENWDHLPMLSPDLIQARAPPLKIFFPLNDDLRSSNTMLHRSAVVLLGPRAALVNQLPQRIASSIATTFGCQPSDFKVSTVAPEVGDFLVEFPSNVLRNLAVHVGVFIVARGVEIQLREWTPNMNMERDPTTHKVRVKLRNVPLQYWNLPDVNHLISGFGYVDRMAPVVVNGNFVTLRVLVACFDPANIPPSVELHKNPYATVVFIDIEGWLHNSSPPLHPRYDNDEGYQSSNFGPERRQRGRHATRNLAGDYARNRGNNTPSRTRTGASSNAFLNRTGEGPIKILTRPTTIELEPPTQAQSVQKTETPTVKWVNFEQTQDSVLFRVLCDNGKILNAKIALSLLTTPDISPMWELLSADREKEVLQALPTERGACPQLEKETEGRESPATTVVPTSFLQLVGLQQGETEPKNTDMGHFEVLGPTAESQTIIATPLTDIGLLDGQGPETGNYDTALMAGEFQDMNIYEALDTNHKSPIGEEGTDQEELSQDAPPPGFEGPPKYKRATRRSPRLQKKNTGRYLSAVDRARAARGFIHVSHLMQRPKIKTKTNQMAKPTLEYLKSYEPLTQGHAEAVVSTAGIELTEQLLRKMEEAKAMEVSATPETTLN